MNGINWNTFNNIEPKEYGGEYESILYTLNEAFGAENVTPIPVFNSGYNGSVDSRIAIFAEAWGWKKPYANRIANAVEQSLDPVPLGPDEKLVLVGSSAGGTAAIEALDILENKGIYVDQVILRSSFVGEWWLSNVGQVDYLATDPPWIDTWNYSRESWAPDGISVNEYTVPGLDDHSPSRATNPGAAQNAINELIVNLIGN